MSLHSLLASALDIRQYVGQSDACTWWSSRVRRWRLTSKTFVVKIKYYLDTSAFFQFQNTYDGLKSDENKTVETKRTEAENDSNYHAHSSSMSNNCFFFLRFNYNFFDCHLTGVFMYIIHPNETVLM